MLLFRGLALRVSVRTRDISFRTNAMATAAKQVRVEDEVVEEAAPEIKTQPEQARVQECECGIIEYVGSHRGFNGRLKQRFSDFIVHEVLDNGEEVRLTNIDPPAIPDDPSVANAPLLRDLTDEDAEARVKAYSDDKSIKTPVEIDVTNLDKDQRTAIHRSVSKHFPGLSSTTADKEEKKFIVVTRGNQRVDKRRQWPYPGDFVHFTGYGENRGTFDLVNTVSRHLHCTMKDFNYAGTKDKRAIATQRMSLWKVHPERLLRVNDIYNSNPNPIAIGNISFSKTRIRLGQLSGNIFDIVLRDVEFEKEQDIDDAFTSLSTKGFINYFGTQRFGSGTVRTQDIGLAILKEDWKAAVNLILRPRIRDIPNRNGLSFNECMNLYRETQDASKVFQKLFWKTENEGLILKQLVRQPDGFLNALTTLPRNNRSMYLHAYQSLIWNRLASDRIKTHGLRVLPGDLLVFQEDTLEDVDPDEGPKKIEPVIAEETNIGEATIYDVVLPLPGTKVRLPQNETGDKLKAMLVEDGLTLEGFGTKNNSFTFHGAYRKLVMRPKKLTWSSTTYEDETIRLIPSDLDILNGFNDVPAACGSKKAVKLCVSLPSSTYATVFIRELLKQDIASVWIV